MTRRLTLGFMLACLASCSANGPATVDVGAGSDASADVVACAPAVNDLRSGLGVDTRVDVLKSETVSVEEATAFYARIFEMDPASSALPTSGLKASDSTTICVLVGDNFGDIHTPPPNKANPTITFPSNFYNAAQYVVTNGKPKQVTVGFNDASNEKATVLVLPRDGYTGTAGTAPTTTTSE